MSRRFNVHEARCVRDLTGYWDFAFLGDVDPAGVKPDTIRYDDVMAIPGSWDATPRYAAKVGVGVYRRTLANVPAGRHRLFIDGLHHFGCVYVDGKAVAEHIGGFTRFHIDITRDNAGPVEIAILTDNRIDYARCPLHLQYFDWFHFGGVTRSVEWHELPDAVIDALRTTTTDYGARLVTVEVDWSAAADTSVPFSIEVGGKSLHSETVKLSKGTGTLKHTLELKGAALWSPAEPNLHLLRVHLGDDDFAARIGIRQVQVQGRTIRINGEPVRLLGFNRHESHPQFGHGLPDALIAADVQQIKDMGCNFVRGSHYPQDSRFLDLCDEMGLCVWNESIAWQATTEHLNDPFFVECQQRNGTEMVVESFNHPCVIMWGILNESHSHDATTRKAYETLLGNLRKLDGSRPVTYASNHPMDDKHLDLCDIISINTYPGWYGGLYPDIPAKLDAIVKHLDANGCADKPMIISEIGAGAIYGWRDWNEDKWSEQYQCKLLETVIRHMFHDRDRYAGLTIWQFGDIRTTTEKAIGRPRAFNNKGVVDEYRRPKQAYGLIKQMYGALNNLR